MSERTPGPWVITESSAHEFFHNEWYVEYEAVDPVVDARIVAIVDGDAQRPLYRRRPRPAKGTD